MDDFLLRALLAGYGVAIIAGPLGTFIVWRRMAYFGEALSHTALLGVALGLLIGISTHITVIAVSVTLAVTISLLRQQRQFASDTLLGIFSHSALSLGLIALAFLENVRVDLYSYLFGDILAISQSEIYWIAAGDIVVLLTLMLIWRPLLNLSVHEELAQVEGVAAMQTHIIFMLMIAIVVAAAMKIVGILLITAMLIIPSAAARSIAKSPEQMAIFAALIGILSVSIGLWSSLQWDTPTGPSIVLASTVIFFITLIMPHRQQ